MQEYIVNGLLIIVALLALILQGIGTRPSAGMTRKQKVMLWRILAATVLLLVRQTVGSAAFEPLGSAGRWVRLAIFMAVSYTHLDVYKRQGHGHGVKIYHA